MKDSERDFGLCFLDAGLVVTLTQTDKRNFEDLFLAVVLLYFNTNISQLYALLLRMYM